MNDNFDEETNEYPDEEMNEVPDEFAFHYEQTFEAIDLLADQLCLSGTRTIDADDVHEALFLLWQDEKEIESLTGLYFEEINIMHTYNQLDKFNFAEFQKRVDIDDKLFNDVFECPNDTEQLAKTAWRMIPYGKGTLSSVPALFHAGKNLKLYLQNGDCFQRQKLLKRIPTRELMQIREEIERKFKCELPPLLNS
jgi:hypothetical protein